MPRGVIAPSPSSPPPSGAPHVFTLDVEEHFQVSAFERIVPVADWESHPSRVGDNTRRMLDLLEAHGARATCFTVGWVAKRDPALCREIVARGHELASHTFWHRRITTLTPAQFGQDVREARDVLEQAAGVRVHGFRAPSFSIVPGGEWAFDELIAAGYTYDSSLFPIRRPDYGYPDCPADPHHVQRPGGSIFELPLTTRDVAGLRLPAAGGAYFRFFPMRFLESAFHAAGARGHAGNFYIHPWEIDAEQPVLPVGPLTRMRHYGGLRRTEGRLRRLLSQFRFTSILAHYGDVARGIAPAAA